jgi:hypothetical protein
MHWALTAALAIGCSRQQVLTTQHAKRAIEFWCAANGECFTEQDRCQTLGECVRSNQAWCSQGEGANRFVCGANETRCNELATASLDRFNNACVVQPGGG